MLVTLAADVVDAAVVLSGRHLNPRRYMQATASRVPSTKSARPQGAPSAQWRTWHYCSSMRSWQKASNWVL